MGLCYQGIRFEWGELKHKSKKSKKKHTHKIAKKKKNYERGTLHKKFMNNKLYHNHKHKEFEICNIISFLVILQ